MTANDVTKTQLSVRHRQRDKNMQQTLILNFLNLGQWLKWGPEDVGVCPSNGCITDAVQCALYHKLAAW